MRYEIFIGAVFFFMSLFLWTVAAQSTCTLTDNTLFLKSGPENAHGSCNASSAYAERVTWAGAAQTHTCDFGGGGAIPNNIVIWLSSEDNAHAAHPQGIAPPGYIPICYANLRCVGTPVYGGSCMYSLSDNDNAHIGTCSNPDYSIKIYCDPGGGAVCNNNGSCDPGETTGNCPDDCPPVGGGACPDPDANITAPPFTANCDVFGVTSNINFSQRQARNDTCFDYLWEFGDGTTSSNWNATHQYADNGQRHVTLTVTRKNDGKVSVDERIILIIDASSVPQGTVFVCARISSPLEDQIFNTTQYILFNGNQSFAVEKYNNGNDKLKCKAGPCPDCILDPEGSGATTCSGSDNEILDIDNVKTNLDNDKGWQAVNFLWEFGDGQVYFNLSINGSIYNKLFARAGTYLNKLTVMTASGPGINGTDSVTVNIELAPGCHNGKRTFVDNLGNEFATNVETSPGSGVSTFNQCGGLDGNPSTSGDNCCAGSEGWRCESDSSSANFSHCVKDIPPGFCNNIFSCGNYTTSSDCTADLCGRAEPGGVVGIGCIIGSGRCKCAWNSTACVSRCDVNCSFPKFGSPGPPAECIKTYTQGPCVNQQFLLSWIASITGALPPTESAASLGCTSNSRIYSCGRIAKLAFFTFKNVLGVLVLLIAFYLIINRKKISKRLGRG